MKAPEAYPLGYVEDAFEARTKLAGFFSILLCGGLDRFFQVVIQPAVLLFRDQLVPDHAD